MKVIYKDKKFSINTHHQIEKDKVKEQNIDFWLVVEDKIFSGGAFTLENIHYLMNKDAQTGESAFGSYFWCTDMIILKEMTVECLVKAIQDILNDKSLDISKILTQVTNYT